MTREEAIAVLEKEASIIDDNSIEMTAREWDEFDDLKRDAIPVAIEALSPEEPKTGEWVWSDEDASWMCGACCCVFREIDWKPNYNFCPNCGARMKGADDE